MIRTRRIALLGGSFDPPHDAHIAIARLALDKLGVDRVLLVVAGDPYQKHAQASAEERYEMTLLAAEGVEGVEVSRIEIERPGPSYTIDTVEELLAEDPALEIWLVLGSDAFSGITTWHRWRDLLGKVKVCVVPRPEDSIDEALSAAAALGADVSVIELPEPLPYSSTEIRRAVAFGKAPEGVSPEVAEYIEEHGLYRGRGVAGG